MYIYIYIYRKVGFDAYMPTAQYVEPCTIPSVILSQRCASKLCVLLTCCADIGDVIHTLKIKVGSDNPLGASAVSLDDVVAAHMAVGGSAPYTARVRIYCFKTNLFLSYFRALSRSLSLSLSCARASKRDNIASFFRLDSLAVAISCRQAEQSFYTPNNEQFS